MLSVGKIRTLITKDVKTWFREPFQVIIAVLPLIIIILVIGFFLTTAEVLPAGLILEDDDPVAIELKEILTTAKSGTGATWFAIENNTPSEVLDDFRKGKILGYIEIPANLTSRLLANETVEITVHINNVNDDITKNVMQRIEAACNQMNRNLKSGEIHYYSPEIEFITSSTVDIKFTHYVIAAACALTVMLSSGVNASISMSTELEEGTIKELIMASSSSEIVIGKIITALIKTFICYIIVALVAFIVYGFIPAGDLFIMLFLIIWGSICFSGLGFILAVKIKQLLPAAIAVLLFNIGGWWVGGGIVPAEAWTGVIRNIAMLWPGTYFFRSFTNILLLGTVNMDILLYDLFVTGLFGVIVLIIAFQLIKKEAIV
ncbi:MAG: ABC transporter permease [Candidatus Hodarchaeales archaeon]